MDRSSSSIEQLLMVIQAHPHVGEWPRLATHCRRSMKQIKNCNENDIALAASVLSVQQHPVGLGCVLALASRGPTLKGGEAVFNKATEWLSASDKSFVQLMLIEAGQIVRAYAAHVMSAIKLAADALCPLHTCLRAVQPSQTHLTPCHAAFLQAAIKSKHYFAAMRLLEEEPSHLTDTGLTIADYLLYGYYGGMCALACKQYTMAYHLFELTLTVPTVVSDAIVLAAWRRYQLAYAIQSGKAASLPRHVATVTRRDIKDNDVVSSLIRQFSNGKYAAFDDMVEREATKLEDLGVMGLVKQLQGKVVTHRIKRLTATYLTLPLSSIAQQAGLAGPDEAAMHVLRMSDAGEISARIDEAAGMVEFFSQDTRTLDVLPELQKRLAKIQELQTKMQDAIKECRLEPKYAQTLAREVPVLPLPVGEQHSDQEQAMLPT